ncbi:MAG: hypothetical protein AAF387_20790, partial [Pseudomonadota bacterium]
CNYLFLIIVELQRCYAIAPKLIKAYIPVKLCLGARKMGILRIRNENITETELHLTEMQNR